MGQTSRNEVLHLFFETVRSQGCIHQSYEGLNTDQISCATLVLTSGPAGDFSTRFLLGVFSAAISSTHILSTSHFQFPRESWMVYKSQYQSENHIRCHMQWAHLRRHRPQLRQTIPRALCLAYRSPFPDGTGHDLINGVQSFLLYTLRCFRYLTCRRLRSWFRFSTTFNYSVM